MTERNQPGINKEEEGCGDHPQEYPQNEKDCSQDPPANSLAMSGPPGLLQKKGEIRHLTICEGSNHGTPHRLKEGDAGRQALAAELADPIGVFRRANLTP
jgi:hypothetical protein